MMERGLDQASLFAKGGLGSSKRKKKGIAEQRGKGAGGWL